MIFVLNKKILLIFYLVMTSFLYGNENNFNRIEILVNENIITYYDIIQRMKINAILNRLEINNENQKQLMNAVVEDLVVEKLKNNKIDEYDIKFDKEEFETHEERFYASINYKKEDLEKIFISNNINYSYLINTIEIELRWQKLIYGLYYRITSVTDQEIQDLIIKNPNINKETANELLLQKQLDIKSAKLLKDLRDEATIEYK